MNDSQIPQAWIDIIKMKNPLSYADARKIAQDHPLANALVRKPVQEALGAGFEFSFPDNRICPEAKKRFETQAKKATKWVISTFRLAFIYGFSGLTLAVEGEDTSEPIDYAWLSKKLEVEFGFNAVPPLATAGSAITNQDPNSPEFLKAIDFSVRGQKYHFSRCFPLFNPLEDTDYLIFNESSYGFHPRSIFHRSLPALQEYLLLKITSLYLSNKIGVIVNKTEDDTSTLGKVNESVNSFKRRIIDSAVSGQSITIGINEILESIDLTHAQQALEFLIDSNLNSIAISNGMPSSYLKKELLSNGMADGTHDKDNNDKYLCDIQKMTEEMFEFIDDKLFWSAWTDDFIDEMTIMYESLHGYSRNQIRGFWRSGYERIYKSPSVISAKEQSETDRTKIENLQTVAMMFRSLSNTPELAETVQNIINSFGIFPEFSINFEELAESQMDDTIDDDLSGG